MLSQQKIPLQLRTVRQPQFQKIGNDVFQFVWKERSLKFPVTHAKITLKAFLAREKLVQADENESYKSFAASKSLVGNAIKRY